MKRMFSLVKALQSAIATPCHPGRQPNTLDANPMPLRLHLIAAGDRPPRWVAEGFDDYARRLVGDVTLRLVEVDVARRVKGADVARAVADEGKRMLAAVPPTARVVALAVEGQAWSTDDVVARLATWTTDGRDVALLVGGPDGLAPACLARAEDRWSLGPLTLPHMLVRVIVAEALYRAWTVRARHPYHRAG